MPVIVAFFRNEKRRDRDKGESGREDMEREREMEGRSRRTDCLLQARQTGQELNIGMGTRIRVNMRMVE